MNQIYLYQMDFSFPEQAANINIANISKIGMIKVVGAINGEEFVKDIPLSDVGEKSKTLKVSFVMNKENQFVSAGTPDEFFVCAYHYTNANDNKDAINKNRRANRKHWGFIFLVLCFPIV